MLPLPSGSTSLHHLNIDLFIYFFATSQLWKENNSKNIFQSSTIFFGIAGLWRETTFILKHLSFGRKQFEKLLQEEPAAVKRMVEICARGLHLQGISSFCKMWQLFNISTRYKMQLHSPTWKVLKIENPFQGGASEVQPKSWEESLTQARDLVSEVCSEAHLATIVHANLR